MALIFVAEGKLRRDGRSPDVDSSLMGGIQYVINSMT